MAVCEICGDTTGACRFERACTCWRGVPCRTGEREICDPPNLNHTGAAYETKLARIEREASRRARA